MIIKMTAGAAPGDLDYVVGRAKSLGMQTHVMEGPDGAIVSVFGDVHSISPGIFEELRGVERVQSTSATHRLASREVHPQDTIVHVRDQQIGAASPLAMIAGPCSVESGAQVLEAAIGVAAAGANFLRGGAFKPRTSPYSFQGLADEGLRLLADARAATGLPVITEVMAPGQVELVAEYADVLQIGTRNMQNFNLLNAVGQADKPVLLKRGMMSTIQELLMSAEYILAAGNPNVILCERGIRTFETSTRNTLDINAIPVLKDLTHLPVVVDPSHATGRRDIIVSVSRAAVAAGADGLIIEVHPRPEEALSDGPQSLTPAMFASLMGEVRRVAEAVDRQVLAPSPAMEVA